MKINLLKVAQKILNYSDEQQLALLKFVLNNVPVADVNAEYEVVPGDKLTIWRDWFARDNGIGGTYIYFAPAVMEDLHIFGIKKRGSKHKEVVAVPDDLTLENHEDRMGKRFKMTKSEIARFGKGSREDAFRARYSRDPATGEKL